MSNNYFKFKQFTVIQDKSAMKVGTDGVLLGSWADVTNCTRILDIGTGTGLIALMLAQRAENAKITALEIEKHSAAEALLNFNASPWTNRLDIQHIFFQQFLGVYDDKFDLIVSNPPFFQHSLKAKSEERTMARHNDMLPFSDLLGGTVTLLSENGCGAFILPFYIESEFCRMANDYGLFLRRKTEIKPNDKKAVNRVLLEFSKYKTSMKNSRITIYNNEGLWSEEYKSLTREFYLCL
jgi:tRNA1Val (adenine37-N6)-methyltransferase